MEEKAGREYKRKNVYIYIVFNQTREEDKWNEKLREERKKKILLHRRGAWAMCLFLFRSFDSFASFRSFCLFLLSLSCRDIGGRRVFWNLDDE